MNNEENQSLVPLKFVEPAAQPATAPVASTIDTKDFQHLMGRLIDAINDAETSLPFDIARAKLIAHIDAALEQHYKAGALNSLVTHAKACDAYRADLAELHKRIDKAHDKGRLDALDELHPQWLAEKERADAAEMALAQIQATNLKRNES
jgi:hypothetical protein